MKKVQYKKIKKFFEKHWHILVVFLLAIFFFVSSSAFNFFTQDYNIDHPTYENRKTDFVKWTSPDETSNYIFAKLYGQTGNISVEENYNLYTEDVMRPRSFRSDQGTLKPVSFLGIIIVYGKIVSILGYKVLPFLTPFFASVFLIVFYFFVKQFFTKTNALISVFLAAFFPPFFYYSSRSMFHNVLFVCFLLFSLFFLVLMQKKTEEEKNFFDFSFKRQNFSGLLYASLGGSFLGLAVITRTSELIWLILMFLILFIFNLKKISFLKFVCIFLFFFLALTPAFFHNQILYGSFFFGGYNEMNESIIKITQAATDFFKNFIIGKTNAGGGVVKTFGAQVFHFGFHPKHSAKMFEAYFIKMFFWLFILSFSGIVVYFANYKKIRKKIVLYLLNLTIISFILVLYYGSWEFHDNPNKQEFTIGNSYTRYWLPMYLGLIPFASYFLVKFSWVFGTLLKFPKKISFIDRNFRDKKISRKFFANSFRIIVVALISFYSINFVLIGSSEGLLGTAFRQIEARKEWKKIQKLTESNSTIITTYHDKLFFPERKVIVGNFSDKNMVEIYSRLSEYLPVYYYNFTFPKEDIKYLNSRRLKENGLEIEVVEKISQTFTLYRLKKIEKFSFENNN